MWIFIYSQRAINKSSLSPHSLLEPKVSSCAVLSDILGSAKRFLDDFCKRSLKIYGVFFLNETPD